MAGLSVDVEERNTLLELLLALDVVPGAACVNALLLETEPEDEEVRGLAVDMEELVTPCTNCVDNTLLVDDVNVMGTDVEVLVVPGTTCVDDKVLL